MREFYQFLFEAGPQKNGIACPECGGEMVDMNRRIVGGVPPATEVECSECGHSDIRIV